MKLHDLPMDITRPELIAELMGYMNDVKKTPLSELCKKGDYTQPDLKYPQTKGEYLADKILTLLIT